MASELIPTEEECNTIIEALAEYIYRVGQIIANEEVIKASHRLSAKAEEKSENEIAFEVFNPKKDDSVDGVQSFMTDLTKEINSGAVAQRIRQEGEKLTLLTAKIIRLRDECRRLGTDNAIDTLLK
jgi:hypothetical protein